MKVAHYTGLRKLEICDVPDPRIDRPDAVLLRTDRVGVCGSDVHYYKDGRTGHNVLKYPATLGHECAGTVVEVGAAVTSVAPGDRVAVEPAISCGRCDQCRAGRMNTCRNVRFMGTPGQVPGAVAEYHVLPAENCLPIPESMSLDQAALVEPLSIGLHAVRLGEVRAGARVGVLGSGPIGLTVLLCAKAIVPCAVYMSDLLDERLEVARRCGADWTGNVRRDNINAAIAEQEPGGLDVVFECSGDPDCIDQALRLLAPGGTLVVVGIPPTPQVSVDIHTARVKEITFKNIYRQNGCVEPVIRLISQGRINPDPLLTHHFPLARTRDAFELVAEYRDGVIKAMIDVTE